MQLPVHVHHGSGRIWLDFRGLNAGLPLRIPEICTINCFFFDISSICQTVLHGLDSGLRSTVFSTNIEEIGTDLDDTLPKDTTLLTK